MVLNQHAGQEEPADLQRDDRVCRNRGAAVPAGAGRACDEHGDGNEGQTALADRASLQPSQAAHGWTAAGGPGCPPLPSSSVYIYPYSTAAGAGEIRVSPPDSTGGVNGDTEIFTITACYGPVNWSVSAPSYVTVHPKSGRLRTGQQVQMRASYTDQGVNTNLTVNPGDYVLGSSYSEG
jgi:hypothetical protein